MFFFFVFCFVFLVEDEHNVRGGGGCTWHAGSQIDGRTRVKMILLFRETCYFAGRAEETGKAGTYLGTWPTTYPTVQAVTM